LAPNLLALSDAPILELDIIDSTNNYAMRLIDADTAQPGLTITAIVQSQGKGQRGRQWLDAAGESLLMSIILVPTVGIDRQFVFSAMIANAVADALTELHEHWDVRIKWPNDIIINDKKAGGILIENVLRGTQWLYAIVGTGLNINQQRFPDILPWATSLKIASGKEFNIALVRDLVRKHVFRAVTSGQSSNAVMQQYNELLYRRGSIQQFADSNTEWEGFINEVTPDGRLHIQLPDGNSEAYVHGAVQWVWGR
jgi:BirA family biotin operon repressor/biotin-[acetyl-CoA-carboxylase] ligase